MTTTTDRPQLRECGAFYENARAAVIRLVAGLDEQGSATPVPACPAWTVQDVIAHMTGICADVLDGKISGVATDEWTAAQVDARRGRSMREVIEEWDDVGPRFAAMMDDFPGRVRHQPAADVTTHEHDIRGALGLRGARTSERVAKSLRFFIELLMQPGAVVLGLGPLEIRAGGTTWFAGTGGPPTGDMDEAYDHALWNDDQAPFSTTGIAGTLTVDPFELFRALPGRRSAAQIRDYDWSVDPEPCLPIFDNGPFTIRTTDLVE